MEEPKPKMMTLGKHLALERQAEEEQLLKNESVSQFEQFENYDKDTVVNVLSAVEVNSTLFHDHDFYMATGPDTPKIIFLTLKTGENPKSFTHFCNNTSMKWNLEHLHIPHNAYHFGLPGVVMVFARGEFVEGTHLASDKYKYLGIVGVQSVSSGNANGTYEYLSATLIFDYSLSRKELELFGKNIIKCKKNKYGCSLCA